ncbi:MAG TPA: hypothetical protein VGD86_04360 [Devosia sp.]
MRKLFAVAALGLALTSLATAPALAQANERAAVLAACSGSGSSEAACNAAVAAFVAVVQNLPAQQKDALLADLVVALGTSGGGAQPVAAAAIRNVASEFTDAGRAAAAVQVAAAVETGAPPETVSVQALSSPS